MSKYPASGASATSRFESPRARRRRRFCEEYIKDYNGTQAAIRAGYSPTSARQRASELLKTPGVASILELLESSARKRDAWLRNAVLQELQDLAFANILDYVEFDSSGVRLRPGLTEIDMRRAALSGISISKTERGDAISLKMGGKLVALETLAKVLGMGPANVRRQTRRPKLL